MTGSVLLLLQLQLPSSALVEGNVYWSPKNNTDFDYQAKGRLRVERQECQVSNSKFTRLVSSRLVDILGDTNVVFNIRFSFLSSSMEPREELVFAHLSGIPSNPSSPKR